MRALFKVGVIALAGALSLTACGSDSSDSGDDGSAKDPADLETTISILAPSYAESSKSDWEAIISKFNETYPKVSVELQIEGWDDYSSKVQARIQAQDYPDILNDNTFAAAADGGLLYPIDEVMSEETLAAIEPALLANGVEVDGTQWAAPDIATSRLMAYNTDLFEQAGIAEPPKTWGELLDASQKISDLGDDIYGYGMPLGAEEAQVESSLWLWGAGGDWNNGENLVANTPEAVTAFGEMKTFIDAGVTQPDVGSTDRQQAADLFNNGKLGMMMSHAGLLSVTRADFPDTSFDVAPIPSDGGQEVALGVTDFILAFNNDDADRKQATKAFLDLMYSDEMYEGWYKGTGLLPVTTTMIDAAKQTDTDNEAFLEALSYVKFLPVGNPQWDALQSALQGTAGKIQSESPETVLEEIQAQVDAQS